MIDPYKIYTCIGLPLPPYSCPTCVYPHLFVHYITWCRHASTVDIWPEHGNVLNCFTFHLHRRIQHIWWSSLHSDDVVTRIGKSCVYCTQSVSCGWSNFIYLLLTSMPMTRISTGSFGLLLLIILCRGHLMFRRCRLEWWQIVQSDGL